MFNNILLFIELFSGNPCYLEATLVSDTGLAVDHLNRIFVNLDLVRDDINLHTCGFLLCFSSRALCVLYTHYNIQVTAE